MWILGIDPGLATMGYGVIEAEGQKRKVVQFGTINTRAGSPTPQRLRSIFQGVNQLLDIYSPDDVAFEELFFAKNVKTGIAVAHARGVLVAAAYKRTRELYEYTPLQVKQAVVGYGRAEKQQVQAMVKTILSLKEIPKPDDAADAVAIAICHAQSAICNNAMRRR